MASLARKVVLVTGAARGLGREIAQCCAEEGARLVMIDVLDAEGARAEAELKGQGHDASFRRCDITQAADITALFEWIGRTWGRLDGLVNNAALATGLAGRSFDQIDETTWDRVFQINVKGTWMVSKAAVPLLKAAQRSSIVHLASDTALWGGDLFLHYVASKGAIVAMTRGMARELGPHGITVNAIAPGLTPTEATQGVSERRREQYRSRQLLAGTPTPRDVAATAAFLLSDNAAFTTGQVLAVNGGMTL